MNGERQKEEFSSAFIQAAGAAAGLTVTKPPVDDDSVDWTISRSGGNGNVRSPKLDLQIKATAIPDFDGDILRYPLKIKNYDDLRPENVMVPRILVTVVVPEDVSEWLTMTDESLTLRNCAYWMSLRGYPPSPNESTVTVRIPTKQRFDANGLKAIFDRLEDDQLP